MILGSKRRSDRTGSRKAIKAAPAPEILEGRALLALVGVELSYPTIAYNGTGGAGGGGVQYDASSREFDLSATPTGIQLSGSAPSRAIVGADRSYEIRIRVDNSGNLIGGVSGPDLVVKGSVDLDGNGTVDYTGVLLTGEVKKFGYLDDGAVDYFDFAFTPTGGALRALYAGKDITVFNVAEQSEGGTPFTGSFASDYTADAKGDIGTAPAPCKGRDFFDKFLKELGVTRYAVWRG